MRVVWSNLGHRMTYGYIALHDNTEVCKAVAEREVSPHTCGRGAMAHSCIWAGSAWRDGWVVVCSRLFGDHKSSILWAGAGAPGGTVRRAAVRKRGPGSMSLYEHRLPD